MQVVVSSRRCIRVDPVRAAVSSFVCGVAVRIVRDPAFGCGIASVRSVVRTVCRGVVSRDVCKVVFTVLFVLLASGGLVDDMGLLTIYVVLGTLGADTSTFAVNGMAISLT